MAPFVIQDRVSINELSHSNTNNIMLNTYSEAGNMNLNTTENVKVIGILLVDDSSIGKTFDSIIDHKFIVLGTICTENLVTNLSEFRRIICAELPYLPTSFNFLSTEGWPIHKHQEHKIKISHVICENNCICIKKEFEKLFVGIVSSDGYPYGFVFTDFNINLKQLREIIEQELKISQNMKLKYKFVERNGLPVMDSQELVLCLTDVIFNHVVRIQICECHLPISSKDEPKTICSKENAVIENHHLAYKISGKHNEIKRKKSAEFAKTAVSTITNDAARGEKKPRLDKEHAKPILISYVRAEATQYALDLKKELVSMGFSVYLDVHEIKTGSDWQDSLNFAVTHCFLFVPLITSMYGKTRWTNREVKLADLLKKKIVPINFNEHWPPACLAIQFATTQYVPWKLQDNENVKDDPEKVLDSRIWSPARLRNVAEIIAGQLKDIYCKLPNKDLSSKEIVPEASEHSMSSNKESREEYIEGKQKIVISAHPKQKCIAQHLKSMFKKDGYEVWCSVDLFENEIKNSEEIIDPPITPPNLPAIQEDDIFFNQTDEPFNTSEDKSLPEKKGETSGRRHLMSQFSDLNRLSTFSHEKLDHLRTFQQSVNQASVVIVLISEAYTKSTFSCQQVFYCEHRKRVILVQYDVAPIPEWFQLLMGNDIIMKVNNPQFECVLKSRVKRALNPSLSEAPKDETSEAKMNYLVNFLKRNVQLKDICVYITGSSKLTQRSEEICKAIGSELALLESLSLVTGGFNGAADITAMTFYKCCRNNSQSKEKPAVVHILPMRDSEDFTTKARQNPDGSFEAIPYGKTFFIGDSVKERETVVARLLDICIVIEGGPGVIHEIEEFMWNDHFVIPVVSTGGAASGQYGVPVEIFEIPPGVDVTDWSVLSEKEALPQAVAEAVVNIIISLKTATCSSKVKKFNTFQFLD